MWYSYIKTALRKNNLRVDLRVYPGDEEYQLTDKELPIKVKSILSSAIIKGLDIIGIVSIYGVRAGQVADQVAKNEHIDIKVIPGQDYKSAENFHAVFFNLQKDIQPGLPIHNAIHECKKQNGKVMLYDLSKSQAKSISDWQSTVYAPNLVEIYNAHARVYKDLDIDYPRVISSAARSANELEQIPAFSELPRKKLLEMGFISEAEGTEYVPGYLGGRNG